MDISVILCTYNRCELLSRVLEDLNNSICPENMEFEVLIVDNNSSDETRKVAEDFLRKNPRGFRYIFEARQGKSIALNAGIEHARGDILAFTDDDVLIDSKWLWELKKTFDDFDCMGVAGRIFPLFAAKPPSWLIVDSWEPFMNALVAYDFGDKPIATTMTPFGANMAFRKSAFEKYGAFRTDLGPTEKNRAGRGEDTEFGLRLMSHHELLIYAPRAVVHHPVEKKRMTRQYFRTWYFNQGRYEARTFADIPEQVVCYFGVPRYYVRKLIEQFLSWVGSKDKLIRANRQMDVYKRCGEIAELFAQRAR